MGLQTIELASPPASQASGPGPLGTAAWLRALEATSRLAAEPFRIFPAVIDDAATKYGQRTALLTPGGRAMSFFELAALSRRYTRWAQAARIEPGDRVGLLMENTPEYLAIWLGITRAGGIVALLNTSLTGASLAHCIRSAAPRHIVVSAALQPALASAMPLLSEPVEVWDAPRTDVFGYSSAPIAAADLPPVTLEDTALYIFTSGTTGLPKAARVTHRRIMQWTHWFAALLDIQPDDRLYNCLPMFHSVGGVVATGAPLVNGGSVLVRDGFSASRFWKEIADNDCTLFQYIGELCRYLVDSAVCEAETRHRLRIAVGNGLAKDVWEKFQARFHIPDVVEFYAATEGTFSLYNVDGKVGSIGRVPSVLRHRSPVEIVRFDPEQGVPCRDGEGRCQPCSIEEAGEALGRIDGNQRFEGYTSPAETDRKILRDVFKRGDAWFRTGDLIRRDAAGYLYFVDRVGDTFRWKGENVSTLEVAEVFRKFPGVREAIVYGVTIAGTEGRAGMAAIVADETLDLAALQAFVTSQLPEYARPVFIRICPAIAATATFKPRAAELARDGYDISRIDDPVWLNLPRARTMERLDTARLAQIIDGRIRI